MKLNYFTMVLLTWSMVLAGVEAKSLQVNSSGFSAPVKVFEASGTAKKVAVLVLHAKKGGTSGRIRRLARKLAKAGYTAYVPEMPYAGYRASLQDSFVYLDAVVGMMTQRHAKVVIVGHSMGASVGFLYTTAYRPSRAVSAVVMLAPGHLLHRSHFIQESTARDVQTARRLVKQGRGRTRQRFHDVNQGNRFTIQTTAEIYLSYFDPAVHPNLVRKLDGMKLPVLWLDGKDDMLAARMGYENLYARLPKHRFNAYREIDGGHVSMLSSAAEVVISWLRRF